MSNKITKKYAEKIFNELLAFQGYGFCLTYDTEVQRADGQFCALGDLRVGDYIKAPDQIEFDKAVVVSHIYHLGHKSVYRVTLCDGKVIQSTLDHKFLCGDGLKHTLREVYSDNHAVVCRGNSQSKIKHVEYIGELPVMDITVDSDEHLFYANGMVVSNCKAHATSYSVYSAVQLWLQNNYFLEYMCVLLSHVERAKEKKGVSMLEERVQYCISHGVSIHYPNVNTSGGRWQIVGGGLLAPINNIKGFGERDLELIVANRPYAGAADFMDKTRFGKGKFEALLYANALSDFGDVETLYNWYHNKYCKPKKGQSNHTFDFGDIINEETHVSFSKQDLRNSCFEMNGFFLEDNLRIKHKDIYDGGMGRFIEDSNSRIYNLREVKESGNRELWTLATIKSVERNIRSKRGYLFSVFTLTDGVDSLTLYSGRLPMEVVEGAVLVLPLFIDQEEGRIKFNDSLCDSNEIFIVE